MEEPRRTLCLRKSPAVRRVTAAAVLGVLGAVALVASYWDGLRPAAQHRHPSARPLNANLTTLGELADVPLRCGRWPPLEVIQLVGSDGVTEDPGKTVVGWQCDAYTERVPMPKESPDEQITLHACGAWCEEFAENAREERRADAFCCEWQVAATGTECHWANGVAIVSEWPCHRPNPELPSGCPLPLAYSPCAEAAGFARTDEVCKASGQSALREVDAPSVRACAGACIHDPLCTHFAFSPARAAWRRMRLGEGRSTGEPCVALSGCERTARGRQRTAGWQVFRRFARVNSSAEAPVECERTTPYACHAGALDDVYVLGGDGAGSCSQVCLPRSLYSEQLVAQLGAQRGTCQSRGCARFVATRIQVTIPYNVYACDKPDASLREAEAGALTAEAGAPPPPPW